MTTATLTPGTALPPLELPPISRTTLALFGGASGDHNPIHIDLDVAKSAGLDDVFAHGMLSMAYLGRFLTDNFAQSRIRSWGVRFTSITPVHGQPTCAGTVRELVEENGGQIAILDITVSLADGTITLAGDAKVAIEGEAA